MSMIQTGKLPVVYSIAFRIADAAGLGLRWLFGSAVERSDRTEVDELAPSRMTRAGLAVELLADNGRLSIHDIPGTGGLGVFPPTGTLAEAALARKLAVARELLSRDLRSQLQDAPLVQAPQHLLDWLRLQCASLDYEVFFIIHLSVQHRIIAIEPLGRGTLSSVTVYSREVVKSVLAHQSAVVAFAHNHPQGDAQPSSADRLLTEKLKTALTSIDVRVLDHFVIAGPSHFSFAEHGLI